MRGVYAYGCDGPLVRVEPGERVSGAGVKLYDVISEGAEGAALSVHGASVDVYGLWSETVKGAGDLVVEATAGARVHIWGGRTASTPGSVAFRAHGGSRIVLHSVDERYPTEDDCDAASSVERVP